MHKQETQFYAFLGILITIVLGIVYVYRESYWLEFFNSSTLINPPILYIVQGILLAGVTGLILFRHTLFKKRKEFMLLILTLLMCFALLEIGSRAYLCYAAPHSLQAKFLLYGQCDKESLYEPHHYLNYQGTRNYLSEDGLNQHNSYGFRGPEIETPKPEGRFRIVTIGGSTTYTVEVRDWRKDFARQLEKSLKEDYQYNNIEVINAGLGGWNSWESLLNLQLNVLDVQPDLIIVYHNINDIEARLVHPDSYSSDGSGRRQQWNKRGIPLPLQSTVVRMLTRINPSRLGLFVDAPTSVGATRDPGYIPKLGGSSDETLERNQPFYFERNLRNMIAIAKEHNIKIMFATWAYTGEFSDRASLPYFQREFKVHDALIQQVGKTHDIPVYNFTAEMPKDKKYWADGRHVNEEGAALKGKLFAKFVHEQGIIGDRKESLAVIIRRSQALQESN